MTCTIYKKIIEQGQMVITAHNKYNLVEIISSKYNLNCKYSMKCTNCSKIIELGNTLYGKIIIIEKRNIYSPSVLEWTMINNKNNKISNYNYIHV